MLVIIIMINYNYFFIISTSINNIILLTFIMFVKMLDYYPDNISESSTDQKIKANI